MTDFFKPEPKLAHTQRFVVVPLLSVHPLSSFSLSLIFLSSFSHLSLIFLSCTPYSIHSYTFLSYNLVIPSLRYYY